MKKLFVAVLALGALASCQKENLPTEEAQSKTIEINVLNLVGESRAIAGGETAQGTEELCAEFGELNVLFVDANGKIAFEDTLVSNNENMTDDDHAAITGEYVKDETYNKDGKRRWHNVPSTIKKIAVVRYENGDFPNNTTVGLDLEKDVLALAKNMEKNVYRPIETMVLCGVGTLSDTGETHMVGDALYHVWQANVNVAPKFARFEIRKIKCLELGDSNATGEDTDYDFDELVLNSLKWNYKPTEGAAVEYTAPDNFGATLYGSYVPAADYAYPYDDNTYEGTADRSAENTTANEYTPNTPNGAWSWNVLPGEFQNLTIDIDAYAYNYRVSYMEDESDRKFPLYVSGLSQSANGEEDGNAFAAGNIYHIDLIFKQENIKSQDGICVDVEVTVNAWKVVERFPVYGN